MKTKEFIEMLQKEDPSGEGHLRFGGGVPYYCEAKEGYWDGPYTYINEQGQYVLSTKGYKVDVCFKEPEDFVYDLLDDWNPYTESTDGLWEKVKGNFKFELSYSIESQRKEREDSFMKPVKEFYDYWVVSRKESWDKSLNEVIDLHSRGCRFFRKKDVKYKYYEGWEWINKKNSKDVGCANLHHTYPILESGMFQEVETDEFPNNEYYEYVLKIKW